MNEYLAFRKMITPTFIQVIFWIGVVACVIGGIGGMVAGANARFGGGAQVFSGLLLLILGPIFVRIYCELLIVVFRILDVLKEIRDGKASSNSVPTDQM